MKITISVLAIGKSTYPVCLDLCLTSRALGASEITFVGKQDTRLVRHLGRLSTKWGGKFRVNYVKNYREVLKQSAKYKKVYLTRLGEPLQSKNYMLRTYKNIVLVVTPSDGKKENQISRVADFNISVSSQPHCSTAAVAIFLHEYYEGRELAMHFENAKYKPGRKES